MRCADFLVIGGGIVGISIARSLKQRYSDATILLIDKEPAFGVHASGRNSGVLHAGFYYASDSLKARFARDGNERLTRYCVDKGLPIRRCGKLVVAQSETELPELLRLYRQGLANGVTLDLLTERQAADVEPRARTVRQAIFSPTTSTVNPIQVVNAMADDAEREGIGLLRGTAYRGRYGDVVATSAGDITAGYVVNAAGLHADTIAREYGFAEDYRILPFRGLYLYGDEQPESLRVHVYPVPDPNYPFLGVHFTVTVDGHVKIGPNASPALWREQYGGWSGFDAGELMDVAGRGFRLLAQSTFDFRRLAWTEMRKTSRSHLVALASHIVRDVRPELYRRWGRTGIRAQLVDTRTGKLETDFVIEGDSRSMHILNAVSPGFTCSLPFGDYVVNRLGVALGDRAAA